MEHSRVADSPEDTLPEPTTAEIQERHDSDIRRANNHFDEMGVPLKDRPPLPDILVDRGILLKRLEATDSALRGSQKIAAQFHSELEAAEADRDLYREIIKDIAKGLDRFDLKEKL